MPLHADGPGYNQPDWPQARDPCLGGSGAQSGRSSLSFAQARVRITRRLDPTSRRGASATCATDSCSASSTSLAPLGVRRDPAQHADPGSHLPTRTPFSASGATSSRPSDAKTSSRAPVGDRRAGRQARDGCRVQPDGATRGVRVGGHRHLASDKTRLARMARLATASWRTSIDRSSRAGAAMTRGVSWVCSAIKESSIYLSWPILACNRPGKHQGPCPAACSVVAGTPGREGWLR